MTASRDYRRGEIAALRWVQAWLGQCAERNEDFLVRFPKAPAYQRMTAKYGALTQRSHQSGIDRMIAQVKRKPVRR